MERWLIAVVLGWAACAQAQTSLTAAEVMARVAANQDRTEAARTHYIYRQHVRAVSRKTSGRVMCEEVTDSRVVPLAKGTRHELLTVQGRVWRKGGYVRYDRLQSCTQAQPCGEATRETKDDPPDGLDTLDVNLVESLRDGLTANDAKPDDARSGPPGADGAKAYGGRGDHGAGDALLPRDGFDAGLFPLTTEKQKDYEFTLAGRERMNGRDVYHIHFAPKDRTDYGWKGEAFIDTQAFEPVVVYTTMSRKMPLVVRTLLGTNLPGLGFSVTYAPQAGGVWFPVSFGTEFRLRVLFFLARDVSISLGNSKFEQTHTDARIVSGGSHSCCRP